MASSSSQGDKQASLLLMKQMKQLDKNPVEGFSVGLKDDDNIFLWEVIVIGPEGTLYEGGMFTLELEFPKTYPNMPPTARFVSKFFHPNVYEDGRVCISILHPPGDDEFGYEQANERWLPIHSVESILMSIISMLRYFLRIHFSLH